MMDDIDRILLDRLQATVPIDRRPFRKIAGEAGLDEDEVLSRLSRLFRQSLLSFLGPIYDARALGYRSSLMAMETAPGSLEKTALIVSAYPGVSHCYERGHRLNLWSTLAVPPGHSLADVARTMAGEAGCRRVMLLPVVRRYKLRVNFRLAKTNDVPMPSGKHSCGKIRPEPLHHLSAEDIELVRILQKGLPLVSEPFLKLAGGDHDKAVRLIDGLKRHLERGLIRRVSALVRHRRVGYSSNIMAVWRVDDSRAEEVGGILAASSAVSHCYRRRTARDWPYTHYAMIHGRTDSEVLQEVDRLTGLICLSPPLLLRSGREFKKKRPVFFTDKYRMWHESHKEGVRHDKTRGFADQGTA